MRYCPHCHRLNPGRPQLCHFCGRTWHVRLCPRGHENPPNALLCGTCGSADLTETAGPIPLWVWLIRIIILLFLIMFIASLNPANFRLNDQSVTLVLSIAILLLALKMTLSILPGPIGKVILFIIRIARKGVRQVLLWLWEKLQMMFN
jgi:hypothetical protein